MRGARRGTILHVGAGAEEALLRREVQAPPQRPDDAERLLIEGRDPGRRWSTKNFERQPGLVTYCHPLCWGIPGSILTPISGQWSHCLTA